jgi:hypothetical protein
LKGHFFAQSYLGTSFPAPSLLNWPRLQAPFEFVEVPNTSTDFGHRNIESLPLLYTTTVTPSLSDSMPGTHHQEKKQPRQAIFEYDNLLWSMGVLILKWPCAILCLLRHHRGATGKVGKLW